MSSSGIEDRMARTRGWAILLGLFGGLAALGVYLNTPATYRWKEEVRLHDGRLIVVERSRRMSGPREPFRSATVGKWTLIFENPDKPGNKIKLDVHGGADPMLLGFVQGVPYMAIQPGRGDARYFYNCPSPPYIFFRYDGEWKRIELKEFPKELVDRNMPSDHKGYRALSEKGGTITTFELQKEVEFEKTLVPYGQNRDGSNVRIIRPHGDETQYDCNRPGALHAQSPLPHPVAAGAPVANESKTSTNTINGRK